MSAVLGSVIKRRSTDFTDADILIFIWRWKVVSTSFLSIHFYGTELNQTGYRKINQLLEKKWIEKIMTPGLKTGTLFGISKLGFKLIKNDLPELRAEGYKSETPIHDQKASACHYWLASLCTESEATLLTEAELRNINIDSYPEPFPKTQYHRPDGYIAIQKQNDTKEVIAVEFERSGRSSSKYEFLDSFYTRDDWYKIDKVIWICDPMSRGQKITNEFKRIRSSVLEKSYFFSFDDLVKKDFQATTIPGTANSVTITTVLRNNGGRVGTGLSLARFLCEMKAPFISPRYQKMAKDQNTHCI